MKASSGSSCRLARMRPALAYSRTVRWRGREGAVVCPLDGYSWGPAAPVSRHESRRAAGGRGRCEAPSRCSAASCSAPGRGVLWGAAGAACQGQRHSPASR
eukprot:4966376-Prymnesium_polylepis.2